MLEIKNISKKYDNFSLENINFSVEKGDYFVLLGVSGSGKSMLLEIIAGLIKLDSGSIILNEKDITEEKIQKRNIGIVFQDLAIFPHLTVYENIAYSLNSQKINKKEINSKVNKIAEELSVELLLNRKPSTLSGGELQRVALARILLLEPELLLLDEPLSSVDSQKSEELRALLRKINRGGQTIIHVTHEYEEAISLANKIAIINNGKIIQIGTPEDVFQHPKSEFVAHFTGTKNFFAATLINGVKDNCKSAIINSKISFSVLSNCTDNHGFVMISSNEITLSNHRIESSSQNNFEGIVIDIVPARLGIEIHIDVGIKLIALVSHRSSKELNLEINNRIWASFKASAVRFINIKHK